MGNQLEVFPLRLVQASWAAGLLLALAACSAPSVTLLPPQPAASSAPIVVAPSPGSGMPTTIASPGGAAPGTLVWPAPSDVAARIHAAGLDAMEAEAFTVHVHPHLVVFKDGQQVTVPAGIGIDPLGRFISPLHTHAAAGTVHIESPSTVDITLGQFFTEWNVPLAGAKAYLDGQPVADPAGLVLKDKQMIVVAFGPPPATIPSVYPGYQL